MRRLLTVLLLPLLLGASIPDSEPDPVVLSHTEQRRVDAGKVVVRLEPSEQGGFAIGILDSTASPKAMWDALMDVEARVAEIGNLKSCTRYKDDVNTLAARWVVGVMGVSVQFHIEYRLEKENGFVRYWLDTDKENDLVDVQGAYHIYAHGSGTRLVYMSTSSSGRRIPTWIKNWLATGSLVEQMTGIRKRAEAG